MQELVSFILKGIVSNPEAVTVQELDGESSVLIEIGVDDDDRIRLTDNDGQVLRNLRAVANAASGRKQAVIELLGNSADVGTAEEE